jgi:hypothetical protein
VAAPKPDRCRPLGDLCNKPDECCAGTTCAADTTGTSRCLPAGTGCAADGLPCSIAAQCCGGACLPDGNGGASCRSRCAPLGAACVAGEDCCDGLCAGGPGAGACASLATEPPGERCTAAGAACDPLTTFCCAGTTCAVVRGGGAACAMPRVD